MPADTTATNVWPDVWAGLYDAMDVDRGQYLDFYTGLVDRETRSLLDLGCGTGSITLVLAERMVPGGRVVGVDLSPEMIEIARARAPQYEWRVGGLTAPAVEGPFDLAVICFHTLQVLTDEADLARCFRAVAERLAPGGRFAFDIYRPNLDWLSNLDPAPQVVRHSIAPDGRAFEVVETDTVYDPVSRVLSSDWVLRDAETGAWLPADRLLLQVRQYFPEDIERALAASGLVAVERYGDLDRRPFAEGTKRQVYVCRAA